MGRALVLFLLSSLIGGCGDDDSAADAPTPDAGVTIDWCAPGDPAACAALTVWQVSPGDPTFPTYDIGLRVAPGLDGLTANVNLTGQDGVFVTNQDVALSYAPTAGASLGTFPVRLCGTGTGDGQQTSLMTAVRRSDQSPYASRTAMLAVHCSGDTCAQDCPAR